MIQNKKKYRFRKILLTLFISFSLVFSPVLPQKADAFWGEFVQEIFHFSLREVMDLIRGLIMGVLKQSAVSMINSRVNSLVGGGDVAFIYNWEDYLIREPQRQTAIYMNDYLSQMTRGRGTRSGYVSEGFGGSNYMTSLSEMIKAGDEARNNIPKPTYEEDPSRMFESGDFKNMNNYLSGVNNPWAFEIAYRNEEREVLENERALQRAKSDAYDGFTGTPGGAPHTIVNPGILAKENVANTQKIPFDIIASAQSIPEVITSVVSQVITSSIQKGFSGVQKKIQKSVDSVNRYNSEIDKLGPGARFR
jgi:hypothetical protein